MQAILITICRGRVQSTPKCPELTHLFVGLTQRIFIYTEGTAAPFVFTKSVSCLRKPGAERKTTTELLLAEW